MPDVSNVFAASLMPSDHLATLHGVVFDILVGRENRVGVAAARRSARTGVAAGDLRPNVVRPARPALGI